MTIDDLCNRHGAYSLKEANFIASHWGWPPVLERLTEGR